MLSIYFQEFRLCNIIERNQKDFRSMVEEVTDFVWRLEDGNRFCFEQKVAISLWQSFTRTNREVCNEFSRVRGSYLQQKETGCDQMQSFTSLFGNIIRLLLMHNLMNHYADQSNSAIVTFCLFILKCTLYYPLDFSFNF